MSAISTKNVVKKIKNQYKQGGPQIKQHEHKWAVKRRVESILECQTYYASYFVCNYWLFYHSAKLFSFHYSFRYNSFNFLEGFPLNILSRYFLHVCKKKGKSGQFRSQQNKVATSKLSKDGPWPVRCLLHQILIHRASTAFGSGERILLLPLLSYSQQRWLQQRIASHQPHGPFHILSFIIFSFSHFNSFSAT